MKNSHTLLPFLAGGAVGMTSCALLYPLTFCNTRISVDVGDNRKIQREFQSLNDCLRKVQRNDGCKGFYQGVTFSATGMFLYRFKWPQLEVVLVVVPIAIAEKSVLKVY